MDRPLIAHLRYLFYVLRHKWYVFVAGLRLGLGLWQLLIHDYSKFGRAEWGPYVRYFYNVQGMPVGRRDSTGAYTPSEKEAFAVAWLHHLHTNPHHWEWWVARSKVGEPRPIRMPMKFVREMVADWKGAGQAQGMPDTQAWYAANSRFMMLHPDTRKDVEAFLSRK